MPASYMTAVVAGGRWCTREVGGRHIHHGEGTTIPTRAYIPGYTHLPTRVYTPVYSPTPGYIHQGTLPHPGIPLLTSGLNPDIPLLTSGLNPGYTSVLRC